MQFCVTLNCKNQHTAICMPSEVVKIKLLCMQISFIKHFGIFIDIVQHLKRLLYC